MAESALFMGPQTIGCILCCKCGFTMMPNGANMCAMCLQSEVDITEGLRKHMILTHCPGCDSYLNPPSSWIKAGLESKELLKFCTDRLKRDMRAKDVRMTDAAFVWTEPHSKMVKVKVKVQKEVLNSAILQESYVVEFVQQDHLCTSCQRLHANPDQWVAVVQLRQHVSHKRTFFHLEQLILKHGLTAQVVKVEQADQGIDFFFANRSHAVKFVEFLGKVAPVRSRNDKRLVSHDCKSDRYNYKHTFSVEICPICRDDLICLPPQVAHGFGNLGPLVMCIKVSNRVALMDPFTLRFVYMNSEQYWRVPFKSLFTSRQLVEYIVLDVEPVFKHEVNVGASKLKLADVQVARKYDFGRNDNILYARTHLGCLLKAGDWALGYDIYGANSNDLELEKYKHLVAPDVILIKKGHGGKGERNSANGNVTREQVNQTSEYERFLRDLETDPNSRFSILLSDPSERVEVPLEQLEELFGDIDLSAEEDDEDDVMVE